MKNSIGNSPFRQMIRLIVALSCLPALSYGQSNIFQLDELHGDSFRTFINGKKIIAIGEMHGTTEVPHFVLELITLLKDGNKPLTVALEIESNIQDAVNQFLEDGDLDKLIELEYFKYPDGRTSKAMGELMAGLKKLGGINIVCFDVERGSNDPINRDSLMAVNIYRNVGDGQLIILTGNLHANLKEGYWRPGFRSALFRVGQTLDLRDKLISLNTYFGGGTIWNCMQDGCKERDAFSNSEISVRYDRKNFIVINDIVDETGYNGFIYFDHVTASRPLIEN